ncbi:T9SS type A sorting domain-containing protein [Ferruginibacter yonginensis]|uniref:T9SS type A sorting domain-containing protein n=1 Tax=Ferruginibacter yonginensis TaxID=1310416 RepID=A0ABV8QNN5_9BACT
MLTSTFKKITLICVISTMVCAQMYAQNIRPYTQVFSQNLKGGTAIFGNTITHIVDNNVANTTKMNESSVASNGVGGLGFSQYGNDGENIQPVLIDATLPVVNIFNSASNWFYNNPNSDQGTAWRTLANPTTNWVSATGTFGYGASQTVTIPSARTHYFLKNINIANTAAYTNLNFTYSYDDGIVIYVNGVEVKRSNMPSGTITYNTLASNNSATNNETLSLPITSFVNGNNVIAVEIHQNNANSSDCFFDMSLRATPFNPSNASSADLVLPSGTNTIKFARLYWGGRISSTIAAVADTLKKVKIRKGNSGIYTSLIAASTSTDQQVLASGDIAYQSYVDITSFIQGNGVGTYTVANIPVNAGSTSGGGNYGGWCIMIAYENLARPYNSVRIYDGFSQVFNSGSQVTQVVNLTGLNVPSNTLALGDAIMSTMVWEGDANLGASTNSPAGDYIKVNDIAVSNAVNPVTNFWNGTISKNGAFVTSKNPNYSNQMGIDIDEVQVGSGYGILPNATTVKIEFGTEADQYFPSVFAFQILMKDPVITLNKTVVDANLNGLLEPSEELTYTLTGSNLGPGTAYNAVIIDTLPSNVTYKANSMVIVAAPGILVPTPQTDNVDGDFASKGTQNGKTFLKFNIGTGATSTAGGQLPVGGVYTVTLKVTANSVTGAVINTARITTNSQAGDVFTDDGTALIAPNTTLAVTLLDFKAALVNNFGYLTWSTENELNNDYFDVERSDDGVNFVKLGTVAGNGTTTTTQLYSYNDKKAMNASIVYYRLKIVDLSGRATYSKIIALRVKGALNNSLSVFPNPFEDNIKISYNSAIVTVAQCRILSFDGKEVLNRKVTLQRGENIVVLNDLNNLASGSYMLELNTGDEKLIKKIIKK